MSEDTKNDLTVTKFGSQDVAIFNDEDFGAGFQEMDSSHTIVPILKIIQALSPQLQKSKPQYVKEAKSGMFVISSTNEVLDGEEVGATVIPVYFSTKFIEWRPRAAGGGIAARYKSQAEFDRIPGTMKREDKAGWITKDGNEIIEYYDFFAFLLKDGVFSPILLSFKGSAIRTAKVWNSQLKGQTQNVGGKLRQLPMFSYSWTLRTQEQSNSQGSWHGLVMSRDKYIGEIENGAAIVAEARLLVANIVAGTVRGAEESEEDGDVAGPAGGKVGATGSDTLS
jgi:hypothetical protein